MDETITVATPFFPKLVKGNQPIKSVGYDEIKRRIDVEERIVDPETGGEKGRKMARFGLIPADFLKALAEHYGRGAAKYSDDNWKKGYKWSLSYDAMHRHINLWACGESFDKETGSHHLVAAVWHCICLWWFEYYKAGTDDVRS